MLVIDNPDFVFNATGQSAFCFELFPHHDNIKYVDNKEMSKSGLQSTSGVSLEQQ